VFPHLAPQRVVVRLTGEPYPRPCSAHGRSWSHCDSSLSMSWSVAVRGVRSTQAATAPHAAAAISPRTRGSGDRGRGAFSAGCTGAAETVATLAGAGWRRSSSITIRASPMSRSCHFGSRSRHCSTRKPRTNDMGASIIGGAPPLPARTRWVSAESTALPPSHVPCAVLAEALGTAMSLFDTGVRLVHQNLHRTSPQARPMAKADLPGRQRAEDGVGTRDGVACVPSRYTGTRLLSSSWRQAPAGRGVRGGR